MQKLKGAIVTLLITSLIAIFWSTEQWWHIFGLAGYFMLGWCVNGYYNLKERLPSYEN